MSTSKSSHSAEEEAKDENCDEKQDTIPIKQPNETPAEVELTDTIKKDDETEYVNESVNIKKDDEISRNQLEMALKTIEQYKRNQVKSNAILYEIDHATPPGLKTIIAMILHGLSWVALILIATIPFPMSLFWLGLKFWQMIFKCIRSLNGYDKIKVKNTENQNDEEVYSENNYDVIDIELEIMQTLSDGDGRDAGLSVADLALSKNGIKDCFSMNTGKCCACNKKLAFNKFYYWWILGTQYEIWWGIGCIINSATLFILLETNLNFNLKIWTKLVKFVTSVSFSWRIGLFTFFLIFGVLLLLEGLFEVCGGDFYSKEIRASERWQAFLFRTLSVPEDQIPGFCNSYDEEEEDSKSKDKTQDRRGSGQLFHYWMLSGVVSITFAYITTQIEIVISEKKEVTFDAVYAWIAIIITNILVGYKLVVAGTKFMVKYYSNDDYLSKLNLVCADYL